MFSILRTLLFRLDAETAHGLTIALLKHIPMPDRRRESPMLGQKLFGLDFPNPVGLAAGFDKNAEVPDAMLRLGFGFVEVGTITPEPQQGNPRPRIFRLVEDAAIINRLGFNNQGWRAAQERLKARLPNSGIVGINVGANRDSHDRAADYAQLITAARDIANYITLNISSPNTVGLRALQGAAQLDDLLARCVAARGGRKTPLLLKVAPDLEPDDIEMIAAIALKYPLQGLIISNTTLARPSQLRSHQIDETGGLSGAPLFEPSTSILRAFYRATQGLLPLIGVGGIGSAEQAYAKIRAGASLVQLYSALVYQGPGLVSRLTSGLEQLLRRDGFKHIHEAIGVDARKEQI